MPFPRVFISSTYVDLADARSTVLECLVNLNAQPIAFERGGISYDHSKPMDLSCYDEVKECDMMILIIGGRYGTIASNQADHSYGKVINSITKTEYLQAISAGIKVITFIKNNVFNEYFTYINQPKDQQRKFKPASVDNIAIFKLIFEIRDLRSNNEIVEYNNAQDIVDKIKKEFALLAQRSMRNTQETTSGKDVIINAYKLFYYRRQRQMSLTNITKKTGLKRNLIVSLESVKAISKLDDPHILPFRTCKLEVLQKLEAALECTGQLLAGKEDDILSQYVNYYHCNRSKKPTSDRKNTHTFELFPKKAVVLDFDGTLTTKRERTTWEMIWVALGYSSADCSFYHRQYSNGLITHAEWCNVTAEKFREKLISEATLFEVAKTIELIEGVAEFVEILEKHDIEIHILSGSIEQIIKLVLGPDLFKRFTHIQANSLKFTNKKLSYIAGTKYDFEGKADYIKKLIQDRGYSTTDVIFIGNSSNDRWASRSGVTTVCVNPHFTDGNDEKEWIYCIREMDNIMEVLQYIPLDR